MSEHVAEFRFYEELNDFLPCERRKKSIRYAFNNHPAIKDSIEALGVPHTEVDLITVNDISVGFDHQLQDGDRVAVYPCFEGMDISSVQKLRGEPLRKTAFVLDVNLGTLAGYLRLCGFDAIYRNDYTDSQVAEISVKEHRIVLTRDRELLFRKIITHGYFIRSRIVLEQLKEVIDRFDLAESIRPFERCAKCNGVVRAVAKEAVVERLEPLTRKYFDEFSQCAGCGSVYWKGSHYEHMVEQLRRIGLRV